MTIRLIHPSRSRPQKAYVTAKKWMGTAGHSELYVRHTLSLDTSDPKVNEYKTFFQATKTREILINNNSSVVEATNVAAKNCDDDILIYLSDDFDCPINWAPYIFEGFRGVTEPMLLKVDDCLQPFKVGVVTIPIMNRALYEKLGYFWHPDYLSMHVDVDLYETCKKHGFIKYAPHLKFPHNHYSNGKAPVDETYKRSEANWNQGAEVLKRRRAQGFPI
jgi:hypothetical protein